MSKTCDGWPRRALGVRGCDTACADLPDTPRPPAALPTLVTQCAGHKGFAGQVTSVTRLDFGPPGVPQEVRDTDPSKTGPQAPCLLWLGLPGSQGLCRKGEGGGGIVTPDRRAFARSTTVLVISDLHLGGEPGFQMCSPQGQRRLRVFLEWSASQRKADQRRILLSLGTWSTSSPMPIPEGAPRTTLRFLSPRIAGHAVA